MTKVENLEHVIETAQKTIRALTHFTVELSDEITELKKRVDELEGHGRNHHGRNHDDGK